MTTKPLNGARIWLSGAIPPDASDSQSQALATFIAQLATRVFRDGGSIIHGSHPAVSPLLLEAAKASQASGGTRDCLTLAISQHFPAPPDDWHDRATEHPVTAVPGEKARDDSLAALRLWMAERCDAVVAVGGLTWPDNPARAGKSGRSGGIRPGARAPG